MLNIRRSNERGYADHGWLKSNHTFSFASYYDPQYMGFKNLRVINEDIIASGMGFGAHPHRDMEIISYVASGALQHKDSMGTQSVIKPGEVQHMSAGSGVVHSEHSVSLNSTHLFQIWILPRTAGGAPRYGQKSFEAEINSKNLVLVASGDGRDGSLLIGQDADMYISRLKAGEKVTLEVKPGRGVWAQVIKGNLAIQDLKISAGDAVNTTDPQTLLFKASEDSEIILFDLA